jgi:hypothetical protein
VCGLGAAPGRARYSEVPPSRVPRATAKCLRLASLVLQHAVPACTASHWQTVARVAGRVHRVTHQWGATSCATQLHSTTISPDTRRSACLLSSPLIVVPCTDPGVFLSQDGVVHWYEGAYSVAAYLVYVLFMTINERVMRVLDTWEQKHFPASHAAKVIKRGAKEESKDEVRPHRALHGPHSGRACACIRSWGWGAVHQTSR